MEWFSLNDLLYGVSAVGFICGILTKSYQAAAKRIGYTLLLLPYVTGIIVGIAHSSLAEFAILGTFTYAAHILGEFLTGLTRYLPLNNPLFAKFFASRRAFSIARSEMEICEVDCEGYKLRILRPGKTAAEKHYDSLNVLSDLAALKEKGEVDVLTYVLRITGGRSPGFRQELRVKYTLSYCKDGNLCDFECARKAVTEYVCAHIFSPQRSSVSSGKYNLSLRELEVNAGNKPFIRYHLIGNGGFKHSEYLHAPVGGEMMLTIQVDLNFEHEDVLLEGNIIEFLLSQWQVLAADGTESCNNKAVGWSPQRWPEVEPPPIAPAEFISQDEFAKLMQKHADDPLMWDVFIQSANYQSWFAFQYAEHKAIYREKYTRGFQQVLANYRIMAKRDSLGLAHDGKH